ncbi:MAG: hypothetical protein ACE5F4_02080 [Candidatus Paceibacteria bacterium]
MEISVPRDEENAIIKKVEERTDGEAARIRRYLAMPDLARTPGSPIYEMVKRLKEIPSLKEFDDINIPEVVPAKVAFDLFDFEQDHPARSKSDTYYMDEENILRPHDTVFWYYYLKTLDVKKKVENKEPFGTICYGKVYRKDEIDRNHMNVFHQFGAWYLIPDSEGTLTLDDLKKVLVQIVKAIFGENVEYRLPDETFPYTDPSTEVEVKIGGEWLEILGSGIVKKSVLKNVGLEGYNGWAFGFGLERLAMISMQLPDIRLLWSNDERVKKQLVLGHTYEEVSKYPPVIRDISFIVPKHFVPNDYFDMVRETVGDEMVEEVELLDKYENDEKFGAEKMSYAYRITYRALDRTLTNEEVDVLHTRLEEATAKRFDATIR